MSKITEGIIQKVLEDGVCDEKVVRCCLYLTENFSSGACRSYSGPITALGFTSAGQE